jgi:hypothetical protein
MPNGSSMFVSLDSSDTRSVTHNAKFGTNNNRANSHTHVAGDVKNFVAF